MAVVALEIKARQALAGGEDFADVGPYTQLDGTAHFAVDPTHFLNRSITDIGLAPRNSDGLVHFSADIRILTPEDPRRGNHRLLFDVPNRGNRLALSTFNRVPRPINPSAATDAGDGFLMRHGYTVVWCRWQHDVPATEGLMRIKVPKAQQEGGPVSGRLLVSFQPSAPGQVQLLSDRGHRPYSSNNLDDQGATLLVRDGDDDPPRVIPREEWSFARLDGERVVPDPDHVYLAVGVRTRQSLSRDLPDDRRPCDRAGLAGGARHRGLSTPWRCGGRQSLRRRHPACLRLWRVAERPVSAAISLPWPERGRAGAHRV
jgi:hypothetical protein